MSSSCFLHDVFFRLMVEYEYLMFETICQEKICNHCRQFYVLMPRREGDGECILPGVEFGTVEVNNGHLFSCFY